MVTVLSVCCIGILAVCILVGGEKPGKFEPDPPILGGVAKEWEEPEAAKEDMPGPIKPETGAAAAYTPPREPEVKATYPQVVEESGNGAVIDFTPPVEEKKTETPPKPVTKKDTTNPEAPPSYSPEELKPKDTDKGNEKNGTPAPGSSNGNGQFYVPGFGWATPSPVEQIEMDNDGDPNKMVGDM
jgi:hypothetical protein